MKKTTAPKRFFPFSFMCSTIGHNFIVSRKITNDIKEYQCKNCGCEMTDNFNGKRVVLNSKNKEANECLFYFFQKKQKRLVRQAV